MEVVNCTFQCIKFNAFSLRIWQRKNYVFLNDLLIVLLWAELFHRSFVKLDAKKCIRCFANLWWSYRKRRENVVFVKLPKQSKSTDEFTLIGRIRNMSEHPNIDAVNLLTTQARRSNRTEKALQETHLCHNNRVGAVIRKFIIKNK